MGINFLLLMATQSIMEPCLFPESLVGDPLDGLEPRPAPPSSMLLPGATADPVNDQWLLAELT